MAEVNTTPPKKIKNREMHTVAKIAPGEIKTPNKEINSWWSKIDSITEKLKLAVTGGDTEVELRTQTVLVDETGDRTVSELNLFLKEFEVMDLTERTKHREEYDRAMEYRTLLPQAIYLMVEDGPGWDMAISAQDVDDWLPPALKGLGAEVVGTLVGNEELRGILDEMDQIVANTFFASPIDVEGYVSRLNLQMQNMLSINSDEPGFIDEKSKVGAYLQYKRNQAQVVLEGFSESDRVIIPVESDRQLEMARKALNYLEDADFRMGDLPVMRETNTLIALLLSEKVTVEVQKEISARLHLHFLYPLMYNAGGFLNPQLPNSIPNALQSALGGHNELGRVDMLFFLKSDGHGLDVRDMWDEQMKINYKDGYINLINTILNSPSSRKFLEEMKGDTRFWEKHQLDPNEYLSFEKDCFGVSKKDAMVPGSKYFGEEMMTFQFDSDEIRKEVVKRYVISQSKYKEMNRGDLSRGFDLAKKLIVATGEDASMNAAFAGHHDLSEIALTEANSRDRQSKGKTIGSDRAIRALPTIATTWLRAISGKDIRGPLYTKDINVDAIRLPKGSEYFYYTAIMLKKLIPYQQAIMAETFKVSDLLNMDYWKGLYDAVNKVAKYASVVVEPVRDANGMPVRERSTNLVIDGREMLSDTLLGEPPTGASKEEKARFYKKKEDRLKEIAAEGIVHIFSTKSEIPMTKTELEQLGELLTREIILDDDGRKVGTFLNAKQWKSIFDEYQDEITGHVVEGVRRARQIADEKAQSFKENLLGATKIGGAFRAVGKIPGGIGKGWRGLSKKARRK